MGREDLALRFELGLELKIIVDFAVEGDDVARVPAHHGLIARRRQVDDGQPCMPKLDPIVGIDAVAVRPPVRESFEHGIRKRSALGRVPVDQA